MIHNADKASWKILYIGIAIMLMSAHRKSKINVINAPYQGIKISLTWGTSLAQIEFNFAKEDVKNKISCQIQRVFIKGSLKFYIVVFLQPFNLVKKICIEPRVGAP